MGREKQAWQSLVSRGTQLRVLTSRNARREGRRCTTTRFGRGRGGKIPRGELSAGKSHRNEDDAEAWGGTKGEEGLRKEDEGRGTR